MEEQTFIESSFEVPHSAKKINVFLKNLPKTPGVYTFLNKSKTPIYIGKAKNLKNRLSSYFTRTENKTGKARKLVKEFKSLELTLTNNELEALLLEQHLIKEMKPKFNVQFKDDKGYPWIKIGISKEFPEAKPFWGKKDDNDKFFGPFPSSYAVQNSLKLLQKTFKLRNCSDSFFKNRTRPCIQFEIGRCSAPCIGNISKEEYMKDVKATELLLLGKSEELVSNFYNIMDKYSRSKSYEKAATYRDKISSLREIQRLQSISGYSKERDAISVITENGQTRVGVTKVNNGWVVGHKNFIQQNILYEGSVIEKFIKSHYLNTYNCPSNIIVEELIGNKKMLESALSGYHKKEVKIISKLGKRDRGLLSICKNNTRFSFVKDSQNKNAIVALEAIAKDLCISEEISFIECYDISHHSGSATVGGCVVFSKRGKEKGLYKVFNISKGNSRNDVASMVEMIERRFAKIDLKTELPSLIIIDGGKVHLSHVVKKLNKLGLNEITVIAISKGARRKKDMDSIHTVNGITKRISNKSLAHKFIQEIRDESHRFAISIQRKKQKKLSSSSSLDDLMGVGSHRKRSLIRYFGSVEQIKKASATDLMNIPGIGKKTASSIINQLK